MQGFVLLFFLKKINITHYNAILSRTVYQILSLLNYGKYVKVKYEEKISLFLTSKILRISIQFSFTMEIGNMEYISFYKIMLVHDKCNLPFNLQRNGSYHVPVVINSF